LNVKTKLTFTLLLFSLSTLAQKETSKIGDLPSSRWSVFLSSTKNNFLDMANQNKEIMSNISEYGLSESNSINQVYPAFYSFRTGSNVNLRFGAEYRFITGMKTKDVNLSFRTDFQYKDLSGIHQVFAKVNSFLIDSSYVPSMNTTVWRDSVYYDTYAAQITQESFLWTNSFLLRLAENERWSFYSGLQIGFQFNFARRFSVNQNNYALSDTYVSEKQDVDREYYTTDTPDSYVYKEKKLPNAISYHFAIPLGLDFRFTNVGFWNHFHLYGELILGTAFSEDYSRFNFYQTWGLRYKF
jgi:hypothetical protein